MARIPEVVAPADRGQAVEVPAIGTPEFERLAQYYWAYPFDAPDHPPMLSLYYYRHLD